MSDRLIVGTRKGLFVFQRGASSDWRQRDVFFLGDHVSMCLFDERDGALHAGLNLDHFGVKLRRSTDGGKNWVDGSTPAYPPRPDGWEEHDDRPGSKAPWSTQQIWALEAGGDGEKSVLWAGTIPGGLFRSGDGGDSWELVRSLWERPERLQWFGGGYDHAGIHSICVDPRDSRRLTVGVSCGGVWVTEDGGETWECRSRGMYAEYMPPDQRENPNIQDAHRLVQCQSAPDSLWVQHHNGIFRTTDGALSWTAVRPEGSSTFGFAVVVHPVKPETAWFVPAVKDECRVPVDGRFVITRTRDGGKTVDVLSEGLPRRPAYDIVYRHGLDIDREGQRLALGSTTGHLWISEDQGDTWRAVAGHLPPVYCVRFAAG